MALQLKSCLQSQILPPEKVEHMTCLSVMLNRYPNRQFLAHFVVHMPLCLHVLFGVAGLLHSRGGGGCEGSIIWGILEAFWGMFGTVARRRLLCKVEQGAYLRLQARSARTVQKLGHEMCMQGCICTHRPSAGITNARLLSPGMHAGSMPGVCLCWMAGSD